MVYITWTILSLKLNLLELKIPVDSARLRLETEIGCQSKSDPDAHRPLRALFPGSLPTPGVPRSLPFTASM